MEPRALPGRLSCRRATSHATGGAIACAIACALPVLAGCGTSAPVRTVTVSAHTRVATHASASTSSRTHTTVVAATPTKVTVTVTSTPGATVTSAVAVRAPTAHPRPKPAASAPPLLSITALVAHDRSGVIRIQVQTCDDQAIGSGFLVGRRQVATVEHVVDGAARIVLVQNGQRVATGTVIGEDPQRDLALVRTSRPIRGHVFRFAARNPALGEPVTAIGFPLGLPLTVTSGSVSGLGRTIPIDGVRRRELVQTDAALNPGNSGGPLIAATNGNVVGLVDLGTNLANGLGFAVSARVAGPLLAAWRAAPQPVPAARCPVAATPAPAPAPTPAPRTGPVGVVNRYWGDIAAGDYAGAYDQFAPTASVGSEAQFAADEREAGIRHIDFVGQPGGVSGSSAIVDVVYLQTVDRQFGCRTWTGDYVMTLYDDRSAIQQAELTPAACGGD